MTRKIYIFFVLLFCSAQAFSQVPFQTLRVADTLTQDEKKPHSRVILRHELDSIIHEYVMSQPPVVQREPEKILVAANNTLPVTLGFIIIGLVGAGIFLFRRQRQQLDEIISIVGARRIEPAVIPGETLAKKSKSSVQSLENRISELKTELLNLTKENESLSLAMKEYNGIQHEYDSLRQGMLKAYKIRNYPGYDKTKNESNAMQSVFKTEQSVSAYAYEKFLKPLFAIADANKNSPARTPVEEKQKIVDLLVSLSLLYIEYLYLRVNELSIGGKMVDRIQGLDKGNGIDYSLLKKLDTEFGSRALVIKLALQNAGLTNLAYPVFDETDLNN